MNGPTEQPTVETARLLLRPFRLEDAPDVQRLAGDFAVADTTQHLPHPYPDGGAAEWIATHPDRWRQEKVATFAMTLRADATLIGAIGLHRVPAERHAELGYWVGVPYWNRGYATEAVRAVIEFGFRRLALHRIFARHFTRNPASGAVMRKAGMLHEGRLREHTLRWEKFEDLEVYGLLRREWEAGTRGSPR